MNGFGRGRATGRNRWASDHERACQRAAERLSLPLPAAEAAWLDRHLARCSWCADVADEYALQRERLRALAEPPPPRDLWARTSAALDRIERQAGPGLPAQSVFPGRGGQPASQGARSIRGLRAERRASAFRTNSRTAAARAQRKGSRGGPGNGYAWMAPFGALAAMAVAIVVGGTIMLTNTLTPNVPSGRPGGSQGVGGPSATPIRVGAGQVAWLSAGDDGTYSLNFAQVSQVCAANARPACAPIPSGGARHLPTIRVTPHTVLSSPTKSQLVVVDASTKSSGGSLYVVSIPAGLAAAPAVTATGATSTASLEPLASPSSPAGSDGATTGPESTPDTTRPPTPALTAPVHVASPTVPPRSSAAATASDAASPAVDASPTSSRPPLPSGSQPAAPASEPAASEPPSGPPGSPGESGGPAGSGSVATPTPEPTASALAIISNVVVVGETAAYSPDGTMLAFSARPADGSHGPDIFLWRLGDATAHAVTTDHASIFSGWLGETLIGSRAVDANGQPASSAAAGSLDSGAQAPGPDDSAAPMASPAPETTTSGVPTATAEPSPASGASSRGPRPAGPSASGLSRAAGPTLPVPSASPEPARSAAPPSSFDSHGQGVSASSPSAGDAGTDPRTTTGDPSGANAEASGVLTIPNLVGPEAIPQSFVTDPATETETPLTAPAWRPVVDPTGRFVTYWAGTLRYDAPTLTWQPNRGVLVLALWSALAATDPAAVLAPVPLLANGTAAASSGDWDIRWDETGSHIGLWTADASNPDVGRLSLLTVDTTTARVDPSSVLLASVPALAGFSIGSDRIAWATPPGQDGQGSQVQVLAWSGANAGNIDSQPVAGDNPVVVVR